MKTNQENLQCLPLSQETSKSSKSFFFSKSKIDIYIAKVETKMWHAPIGYLFPK